MKPSYIDEWETWLSSFKYRYPIKVRFSETDAFGHVNNTVPFIYFEEARINFFDEIGLNAVWFDHNVEEIPVTADLQCDFIQQMYFPNQIDVYVKIAHIGRASVDLHYCICNEKQETCVTGRGTIVQIHKQTGRPSAWRESTRNLFHQ
ncbi:acyl-CoA thioesterase [Texcoconibacillus texcoconensis]|uniref:Acyl-CoA thioester hydrolase n=1 Tax=Texcoconibacillus texcoconensis TaxID=1095777 RepID=A0A840QMT5_9BACI|nr:thioesterase family protein [Texcoconibacillus texcoconensis]MBB5172668.1 acyl-CoA thioester hydrolase [Texcoconibacillus texcoconensis]